MNTDLKWTEFQKLRIENHEFGIPWFVHEKDKAYEYATSLLTSNSN